MKKEEIIRAINEVDDNLLESTQKARMKHKEKCTKTTMIRRTAIALCTFAVLVVAVILTDNRLPEQHESITGRTEEPAPDDRQERIVLYLSRHMTVGGGMSVVMYPDLKQETDWNPWDTSMDLKELPVYERNITPAGTAYDLGEEEMRAILHEYADWFGYILSEETVTRAGEYDEKDKAYSEVLGVEDGTALYISADSEEARFTCFGNGEVTVFFHKGHEPHVPQPLKMNIYDLSEEDAGKTAKYLADQYGSLLGEGKIRWDIGGDYGYNYQPSEELGEKEGLFRIRHYTFWPEGNNDTETIVNYGLCNLQIWGYDPQDETLISGIRIEDKRRAYQKTADYPLVSVQTAYEQLLAGNCIANAGGILPDENAKIGDVQLVYYDNASSHYVYPCYLFSMDITDALKEKYSMEIAGVRQYGLYWVPAIDPAYYKWH